MTYDLRRKVWIFGAGLLIGYGVTALFSDAGPSYDDDYGNNGHIACTPTGLIITNILLEGEWNDAPLRIHERMCASKYDKD